MKPKGFWAGAALVLLTATIAFTYSNCAQFEAQNVESSVLRSLEGTSPILRRLSVREIDKTLALLIGDQSEPAKNVLPADSPTPFDNDYATQIVSTTLVNNLEVFANSVTESLLSDTSRRGSVIGCSGSAPNDSSCMRGFITRIGRLFFRSALTNEEVDGFLALAMNEASSRNNFYAGAGLVLKVLLQHPRFLYRFEGGEDAGGGVVDLDAYVIATRLSFFLWGSGPDDALLDLAESGALDTKSGIRTVASNMLSSPLARERISDFHSMWLGYDRLNLEASVKEAYNREANRMIASVVLDDNVAWPEIFTRSTTTVDSIVADVYGLTGIASFPATVTMPSGRAGILGMPAFLSVVPKFGDTSPTNRGRFIQEQLLCNKIADPPPNVNADEPPTGSLDDCKVDRYASHRVAGTSCLDCHRQMDPIGFGLENYDQVGRYRDYDYNDDGTLNMSCSLDSVDGSLPGVGRFKGPAELGVLLSTQDSLKSCLVRRVFQFMMGRQPASPDNDYLDWLTDQYLSRGERLQDLILEVVTSDQFTKIVR